MAEQTPIEQEGWIQKYNPFKTKNPCVQCRMIGTSAFMVMGTWAVIETIRVAKYKPDQNIQKGFFAVCGFGINKICDPINFTKASFL